MSDHNETRDNMSDDNHNQADEARELYTVEEIRAAFAKHARPDDWNVPHFYEGGLINALRGEYDDEARFEVSS